MKSYTITVNGTAYEVTVEETGSVSAPAARQLHRRQLRRQHRHRRQLRKQQPEQAQLRLQLPYLERF